MIGLLTVTSCRTTDGQPRKSKLQITMESWVGATESQVVASWGPPTSSYKMDDGTKVLTWEWSSQSGGNSWYDNQGRVHFNAPVTNTCKKMFYINSNGVIYSWRYQGC